MYRHLRCQTLNTVTRRHGKTKYCPGAAPQKHFHPSLFFNNYSFINYKSNELFLTGKTMM